MSFSDKAFDAKAVTGSNTYIGKAAKLLESHACSFQSIFVGTMIGAMAFSVSNDPDAILPDGTYNPSTKWTRLSLPASFSGGDPVGVAVDFVYEFIEMTEAWLRPEYVNTSGTGALDMFSHIKAF